MRGRPPLRALLVAAWLLLSPLARLLVAGSQAFTASTPAPARSSRARPEPWRRRSLCGRGSVAQQSALPPLRIGACQPSRRGLRKRLTELRGGSFTAMVVDVAANPRVLLGQIAIVVLLSGIYEKLEATARNYFTRTGRETGGEIMNHLFKEVTTLGFVAFLIFCVTHTGAADKLAPMILSDDTFHVPGHNPLSATFETVHMIIFLLLVVMLAQSAVMYYISERICARWGGYERTVSYGTAATTIESRMVKAGLLKRYRDDKSPRGWRLVDLSDFAFGRTFLSRLLERDRPLHKLLMWRAIRHEFLFPADVPQQPKAIRVPDPALFSLEDYFRTKLGKVVLSLIHVDRPTWVAALGVLAIPLYLHKHLPHIPNEAVHCLIAWIIAGVGILMAVVLEHDCFQFTPKVPKKPTEILKLFSGESFQMLRRSKLPGWRDRVLGSDEAASRTALEPPEAMVRGKRPGFLSPQGYRLLFRILSFFQAVSFTSLLLSHLTSPFTSRAEWAWYLAAAAEWPFFLFVIVPVLIRRLTIRNSIAKEKDGTLIRKVTTATKESLVRDYARLVLVQGFERRAAENGEPWTEEEGDWDAKQAVKMVLTGLKKYDKMPEEEKREIWGVFAAWDVLGKGSADRRELEGAFSLTGNKRAQSAVENITRLVDFDGSTKINWMKFKAICGLATADRADAEMREDFKQSFDFFDVKGRGELSVFELAEGFGKMNVGVDLGDIANLLFLFFGMAKPTVSKAEFVEWLLADRKSTLLLGR